MCGYKYRYRYTDEFERFWFFGFFAFFWGERVNALKSFVIRLTFVSEMNIHVHAVPASQEQFLNNVAVVSTLGGTGSVNAKLHYPFLQSKTAVIFVGHNKTTPIPAAIYLFFFYFTETP